VKHIPTILNLTIVTILGDKQGQEQYLIPKIAPNNGKESLLLQKELRNFNMLLLVPQNIKGKRSSITKTAQVITSLTLRGLLLKNNMTTKVTVTTPKNPAEFSGVVGEHELQ
jgi:hypothetical protein